MLHTIMHIPIWQYILEMGLTLLAGILLTCWVLYKPKVYSDNPTKRLSAEVTPEFHAEIKSFCEYYEITMKKLIVDAVCVYKTDYIKKEKIDAIRNINELLQYIYDENDIRNELNAIQQYLSSDTLHDICTDIKGYIQDLQSKHVGL